MNAKIRRLLSKPPTERPSIRRLVKNGVVPASEVLQELEITSPKLGAWLKRRAKQEKS